MWNRSRQGIQLTKQRLRDKLLAGPTSRSYFTRPLLSIGERRRERERERAYRVDREKGGRGMARERTTEKCFRQAARIYGWTILSPVSSCSFAAAQRSVYWPASPSVLSRICAATKAVAKVATPTYLEQHATRELSPHPKYRNHRPPPSFFPFSPHFLVQTRRNIGRFDDFMWNPSTPVDHPQFLFLLNGIKSERKLRFKIFETIPFFLSLRKA